MTAGLGAGNRIGDAVPPRPRGSVDGPVRERVWLSKASVTELEEQYVLAALRSGWIAPLGPDVDAFEREIASYVGVKYALALSSGTAALHLALLEMGAGPGTVVIVPTMTFAATANAVMYTGATPIFVDCDEHGNVQPELMAQAIDEARARGEKVAVAIAVDLFGRAADYTAIEPMLAERGVPLLSDAAESLGARHNGRMAGSFGRAAAFSFNGNKIMTTSGGGMLVSNDGDLIERCRYLSTQARQPVVHYEHTEVGYNYRLSNILAALGRAQLVRLDDMIARRREIRRQYREAFADRPGIRVLGGPDDAVENCWLTCIEISPDVGAPRQIMAALNTANIESRPLWKPMHLQPVFQSATVILDGTAQNLFTTGLALPSSPTTTDRNTAQTRAVIHANIING